MPMVSNVDWRTKHGDARKRIYEEWQSMRYRCQNPNHTSFKKYGAKGIKVCRTWDRSYVAFRRWAYKHGYADNLTLDRKNSKKGYYPANCRWVSYEIQNCNLGKPNTNTSGIIGVSWNKKRSMWRCNISLKGKTHMIGDYLSMAEAVAARNDFIDLHDLPHQKAVIP